MRGPTHEELKLTANRHPVIVLVAGDKACYALIIHSPHDLPTNVELKGLNAAWLEKWTDSTNIARKSRGESTSTHDENGDMRSGIRWPTSKFRGRLAELWLAVVKPILTVLGISVSSKRS
jgi:hypothetical protein